MHRGRDKKSKNLTGVSHMKISLAYLYMYSCGTMTAAAQYSNPPPSVTVPLQVIFQPVHTASCQLVGADA